MSKFTPGPWELDSNGIFKGPFPIAICKGDESNANARLISAAPDMYEALKEARDKIQDHINEIYSNGGIEYLGLGSLLDKIDHILAKADGR